MSIMEKFKLDGKVALVTGCSKGIGFGIAKGLAEAGADIIGVSSTLKKGSEIEKYVVSIGKRFHCFNCDFSKRENTANDPPVILFHCEEMGSKVLQTAGEKPYMYSHAVLPIEVPCLRYVSESNMLAAFSLGAAGVGLLGCENCPNGER